jgi:predicted transposase/invertase (TIGR01784 family)
MQAPYRKQRYISIFTDFGFKKIFGEEARKELLIDFLNALLPEKHQITNLEYTKNEASGDTILERKAVFDISCTGSNGERFIVEMQKAKQNFFKDRSVFYSTFPIRQQAERGDDWKFELAAVYCIGILDFVFDEDRDNPEYLHRIQLKNQYNEVFYDKLTFLYLEMPKFTKSPSELASQMDKWLYFIKHASTLDNIPDALHEEVFEHAFETSEIAQFTPAQIDAYETSLKYYRDMNNIMDTAIQEAVKEASERSFTAGIEQGIEQERVQSHGRQVQTARNLKALGISIHDIATATGLDEDFIRDLY